MAKISKKTATKKTIPEEPRKLEVPTYQSFRLQKKIPTGPKLPSAFMILHTALGTIKRHWKLFLGITGVYAVLNLLLVQGMSALNGLSESKSLLEQTSGDSSGGVLAGATLFAQLLGSSAKLSPTAGIYQLILTLITSLAFIWVFRQVYAGHKARVRDGFYQGMYPLVPFVLVLCVIVLQLIPLIVGGVTYSAVVNNGIAVGALELILWATAFFVLAVVSLYMLSSSVFALYVVSLPNVEPLQALRSARELVRNRRWTVLRKIIFLPIVLLVLGGLILIPLIMIATTLAGWVFFVYSMLSLAVIHSYMYGLYRSLL